MAYNVCHHVIGTFYLTTKTYLLRKGLYVMSNLIIPQTNGNGQHTPQTEQLNIPSFIASQVERYREEIEALEAELKTSRVLLHAYESWYHQLVKAGEK